MAARRAKSPKSTSARKSATSKKATTSKKKKKVEAVPARYGTATPSLIVSPCRDALDFYQRAFGARLSSIMDGPDGLVMHAEIRIGDSIIMLSDEMPPMPGHTGKRKTPKNAGAITGGVMLYVKDTDAFYDRAVKAGAKGDMPPEDQFWGDRYAQIEDPFGHVWSIGTHLREVTAKQMRAAMASMGPPPA
jgi:PhnB protein